MQVTGQKRRRNWLRYVKGGREGAGERERATIAAIREKGTVPHILARIV